MYQQPFDPIDHSKVFAFQFKKPIVIHPIKMTTNYTDALINMVNCYKESLSVTPKDGVRQCEHPFMVFCTSCVIAEFLVTLLRETATAENANPHAIQGVWSQLKDTSPFCIQFGKNPNGASSEIDVIVCTSVIGAGFSIDERFEAFHGIFICGILPFEEERQFIQRLRFVMKAIPENAVRQSYLYIEKGRGSLIEYSKVLTSFASVRRLTLGIFGSRRGSLHMVEENTSLTKTAARIEVEKTASRSLHDALWTEYGKVLMSNFEDADWGFTEEMQKCMQTKFSDYLNKRKKDIHGHIKTVDFDDLSACVSELEISQSFDLMRLSDIKQIEDDIYQHFDFENVWINLLDKDAEKLSSKSFRKKWLAEVIVSLVGLHIHMGTLYRIS
jgi:hypothetical protein